MTSDSITVGPINVIEALSRVAAELPGIGKDSRAAQDQGGYAYRGIDAITQQAQPLLAQYGVVFVPAVQSWDRAEVRVGSSGKVWHDEIMQITYTVYGPGGRDDHITVGPIPAIGRDGTDKGANKCMTQAFKYALLQTLCIADKADDGDQYHQEADSTPSLLTSTQVQELKDRLAAQLRAGGGAYPDEWKAHNMPSLKSPAWTAMSVEDGELAVKILDAHEIVTAGMDEAAPDGDADVPAVTQDRGEVGEPGDLPGDRVGYRVALGSLAHPAYTDDETAEF